MSRIDSAAVNKADGGDPVGGPGESIPDRVTGDSDEGPLPGGQASHSPRRRHIPAISPHAGRIFSGLWSRFPAPGDDVIKKTLAKNVRGRLQQGKNQSPWPGALAST